jgi:hypothetical protein
MGVLDNIPGLGAFLAMQDRQRQNALGDLQGVIGLGQAVRQQQAADQEMQLAPLKRQMLEAQAAAAQGQIQDAQRKREFFSPANMQQFMTPGQAEIPAPSAELGGGPGKPGVLPSLDFDRLLQAGVANGVLNPETMITRQGQLDDRRAQREQRKQELEMRLQDARISAQERANLQRELAQMQIDARQDMARLAASMRPPRQPQLLQTSQGYMTLGPDGKPTLLTGPDGKPVIPASAEKSEKGVSDLRKEFNALPEVKNYRTVVPIVQSIQNAKDTQAGDLDFIYAVGKILDPESVVREGEMNLVIKTGSPLERFKGAVSGVMGGGRLTPTIRNNLLQMLNSRVGEIKRGYDSAESMYRRNAERRGLPTDEIFMDFGNVSVPAPAASEKPAGEWSITKKK